MKNALTYLTRRCPRKCTYCTLRDGIGVGKELTVEQWNKAFKILEEMGITFNLILGNETWLLRDKLVGIMKPNKIPYAIYTSLSGTLFEKNHEKFFGTELLDNLSCGMDYPKGIPELVQDEDSYKKAMAAWEAFEFTKKRYPKVDIQATITVHRKNYQWVPLIVEQAATAGFFTGLNYIHWNKDGGFDFFPGKEVVKDLLFTEEDLPGLRVMVETLKENPGTLQNPEFLEEDIDELIGMEWHCKGDPYGGPTIDADGRLRVCGYRRGTRTNKFTIFDLPEKEKEWKQSVHEDAMDCPGCSWSFAMQYAHHKKTDEKMGEKVFTAHAGNHIDKDKWSKRKIE